ncbi:MAG: spore photoproduct lyase [Clostridiales bacterium]|nr:spore photoproduct lyase [Clostridiales bacterium]
MFQPERVIVEKGAREYPLGEQLYQEFLRNLNVEVLEKATNQVKSSIPGDNLASMYQAGKKTLVIGIKKSLKFQSCKPSAHYQLPLVSGCMGQCEYCYLNTQLGDKPYVRVHVNVDEILEQAMKYTKERLPNITTFEGSATSDPVPEEPYTHSLRRCIEFFGQQEHTRFRFVSKYTDIDSLLDANHNGHTEVRFSINTERVIETYEHATPMAKHRIAAAAKLMKAGYPVGFLIAPVFLYDHWKEEYLQLMETLREQIPKRLQYPLTFEVISHRYTLRAKERIQQVFPETQLPMTEEERVFQYGQFGYGKYKYSKEQLKEMGDFFKEEIPKLFPQAEIKYVI